MHWSRINVLKRDFVEVGVFETLIFHDSFFYHLINARTKTTCAQNIHTDGIRYKQFINYRNPFPKRRLQKYMTGSEITKKKEEIFYSYCINGNNGTFLLPKCNITPTINTSQEEQKYC